MKKSTLLLVAGLIVLANAGIKAEDYLVYKLKFQVNEFLKESSKGEWLYDKKVNKLKFGGYFIFRKGYDISGDNAPARIITFKSKLKFRPLDEDGKPDMDKKLTKKLIIYPYPAKNPLNDKILTVEEQYTGLVDSNADSYYIYGGIWSTVMVEKSIYKGHVLSLMDFYGNDTNAAETEDQVIDPDGENLVAPTDVKGYAEIYTGFIKNDEIASVINGYLSYYRPDKIAKSKKADLKYDKKMTEKVLTGNETSMKAAVDKIVQYLVDKKYASTWDE